MGTLPKHQHEDVLEAAGARHFLLLLCTYLLVYDHYKTSCDQGPGELDPAHWLLAQLFPDQFMDSDVFNIMYLSAAAIDERWVVFVGVIKCACVA